MKFVDRTGEFNDTGEILYSEVFCPIRYENAERTLNAVCDDNCAWNTSDDEGTICALVSMFQVLDRLDSFIRDDVLDVTISGAIDTYEQN